MPIGESISDQKARMRLVAQSLSVASILQEEWATNTGALRPGDILAPNLLCRIARIRRRKNLDPVALGALLMNEVHHARSADLKYLSWFTREAELCLIRHPIGLNRYLREQRKSLPKERKIALLFFGISLAKETSDRGRLVSLLASGYLDANKELSEPSPQTKSEPILTQNQQSVLSRLTDLADAFFTQEMMGPIRPRLFPLVAGPTGVGKSFLAKQTAQRLNASFISLTTGDWVPIGAAADYEASLYTILAKLAHNERLVLCLDEMDKVRLDVDGSWGRSVASDIWRVLDLNLPVAAFLKSPRATLQSVDISEEKLRARVAAGLWIVGAGTWQTLHEIRPQMGFTSNAPQQATRLTAATIARHSQIPTELLMRFHPEVLHVAYPTCEETTAIYRDSGLTIAAASVGLTLEPALHDWSKGGMRTLESLWGEVAIRRRKKLNQAFYE